MRDVKRSTWDTLTNRPASRAVVGAGVTYWRRWRELASVPWKPTNPGAEDWNRERIARIWDGGDKRNRGKTPLENVPFARLARGEIYPIGPGKYETAIGLQWEPLLDEDVNDSERLEQIARRATVERGPVLFGATPVPFGQKLTIPRTWKEAAENQKTLEAEAVDAATRPPAKLASYWLSEIERRLNTGLEADRAAYARQGPDALARGLARGWLVTLGFSSENAAKLTGSLTFERLKKAERPTIELDFSPEEIRRASFKPAKLVIVAGLIGATVLIWKVRK